MLDGQPALQRHWSAGDVQSLRKSWPAAAGSASERFSALFENGADDGLATMPSVAGVQLRRLVPSLVEEVSEASSRRSRVAHRFEGWGLGYSASQPVRRARAAAAPDSGRSNSPARISSSSTPTSRRTPAARAAPAATARSRQGTSVSEGYRRTLARDGNFGEGSDTVTAVGIPDRGARLGLEGFADARVLDRSSSPQSNPQVYESPTLASPRTLPGQASAYARQHDSGVAPRRARLSMASVDETERGTNNASLDLSILSESEPVSPDIDKAHDRAWSPARRGPRLRDAHAGEARPDVQWDLEQRLQLVHEVAQKAAYEEVQAEAQQLLRGRAPLQQLEHLRAELHEATDMVQTLGIAVEISETKLRTALAFGQQRGHDRDSSYSFDADDPCRRASEQRGQAADDGIALAQQEVARSTERAHELNFEIQQLQRNLQSAQAMLEEAQWAEQLSASSAGAPPHSPEAVEKKRQLIDRLVQERKSMKGALSEMCGRGTALREECARLRADRAQATSELEARQSCQRNLRARLLGLASAKGRPSPEAPLEELARRVAGDRAEAQRIIQQQHAGAEWMESNLTRARNASSQVALERASLEKHLSSVRQQLQAQASAEAVDHDELRQAMAQNKQMRAAQVEGLKLRSQMLSLIEELRADTRDEEASRNELSMRLAALQRTVNQVNSSSTLAHSARPMAQLE